MIYLVCFLSSISAISYVYPIDVLVSSVVIKSVSIAAKEASHVQTFGVDQSHA